MQSDNIEKFAEFFEQLKSWVEDGASLVILADDLETARKWVDFYQNEFELDEVAQLQLLYGTFDDEKIYTVNGKAPLYPVTCQLICTSFLKISNLTMKTLIRTS